MCVIVDANIASQVFSTPPAPDFAPVIEWIIRRDGSMVTGGLNLTELRRVQAAADFIQEQGRRGRAHLIPSGTVNSQAKAVEKRCRSDDPHVIALAAISGARTLCSQDHDLHADFTNGALLQGPRGKVYQSAKHERLLTHTSGCPGRAKRPARRRKQKG